MGELIDRVERYWDKRANSYGRENLAELTNFKRQAWEDLINNYLPRESVSRLKVLDIGTGPGFFAILMAEEGHEVTAVDYTEAMLHQARNNARTFRRYINFRRMDAQQLDFANDSFDLILTRNLTWNLETPGTAYREWHRVLRKGGRLLNFDANWYLYTHDDEQREAYLQDRQNSRKRKIKDDYPGINIQDMEDIARNLPLSSKHRPEWDMRELLQIGFRKIMIEVNIGHSVWDADDMVKFRSTPMFMVGAEK